MTKYRVTLCAEERQFLRGLITDGKAAAKKRVLPATVQKSNPYSAKGG